MNKSLSIDITRNFGQGLFGSQLNELVECYFDNFGGEDGCEECKDFETLCTDCYQELHEYCCKNFRL